MKNKKTIYHFVIDKSGSMAGMEKEAVDGFNKQLATMQELQQQFSDKKLISSLTFFNENIEDVFSNKKVAKLKPMKSGEYCPKGSTALLDAIGKSIHKIKSEYGTEIENNETSVVLIIITDGHENASRFFTYHEIARIIKELDETEKWTFSFLGADLDAVHTSQMLNIRRENVISFSKSNYSGMMNEMSQSIQAYEVCKSKSVVKRDLFDIFKVKDRRNDN